MPIMYKFYMFLQRNWSKLHKLLNFNLRILSFQDQLLFILAVNYCYQFILIISNK